MASKIKRALQRGENATSNAMRTVREKLIGKDRAVKTLGGLSDESKLENHGSYENYKKQREAKINEATSKAIDEYYAKQKSKLQKQK